MKAERRHELQENSLIRSARNSPQFWRDYGSKISLVIILFLLSLVLVRYWLNNREQTQAMVAEQLTTARVVLEDYRQGQAGPAVLDDDPRFQQFLMMAAAQQLDAKVPIMFLGAEADARIRSRVRDQVETAVAEALEKSSDVSRQAEATLLRADLNLHFGLLASAQASATPATQPTTRAFDKTPDQYLDTAKSNYEELIKQATQIPPRFAAAARFGLAAVHENRGNLAEARNLYDTIFKDGPDPTSKKIAAARIDLLARLPANPLIGPPMKPKALTQPATTQATQPATTQATQPAAETQPVVETQPVTPPSTQPATQPSATPETEPTPATKPAATQEASPTSSATTGTSAATGPATKPTAND